MSNIKELIRQEVERLFEKYQELEYRAERDCDDYDDDDIAFYQGKRKVCHEILSFLDTLPDEPVTDCHDLEEEIKEQIYDRFYDLNGIAVIGTSGYAEVKDMEYIARHFAEWQKRKMMQGAVEGFVGVHLHDKRADVTVNSGYLPKEMGIKGDSKVKIIIVKEDKK